MPIQRESPRTHRTREAVVRSAVDLLVEGGVGAVTVEAVVQRSGVARSTIYRHWPTRGEMVAAAFAELMPPLSGPNDKGGTTEQLQSLLCPLAEEIDTEEFAALVPSLLAGARTDPELASFHDLFVARQREPVHRILTDAVQRGDVRPLDLDEGVSQLVGPLLFQRIILGRPVGADFARRIVTDFVAAHAHHADQADRGLRGPPTQ